MPRRGGAGAAIIAGPTCEGPWGASARRTLLLGQVRQEGPQLLRIGGLDEVMVEARFLRQLVIFFSSIAGQGDEPGVIESWGLPQEPRHLMAIHSRQTDVEQHDGRPKSNRGFQRGRAAVGRL